VFSDISCRWKVTVISGWRAELNSRFWKQRYGKHVSQRKVCGVELKAVGQRKNM